MDMKKIHLFCLCLLLSIPAGLSAQVLDKVRNILGTDSLPTATETKAGTDSAALIRIREELSAAWLNEANLRMELEQMKLVAYAADSVKLAKQKEDTYRFAARRYARHACRSR